MFFLQGVAASKMATGAARQKASYMSITFNTRFANAQRQASQRWGPRFRRCFDACMVMIAVSAAARKRRALECAATSVCCFVCCSKQSRPMKPSATRGRAAVYVVSRGWSRQRVVRCVSSCNDPSLFHPPRFESVKRRRVANAGRVVRARCVQVVRHRRWQAFADPPAAPPPQAFFGRPFCKQRARAGCRSRRDEFAYGRSRWRSATATACR